MICLFYEEKFNLVPYANGNSIILLIITRYQKYIFNYFFFKPNSLNFMADFRFVVNIECAL